MQLQLHFCSNFLIQKTFLIAKGFISSYWYKSSRKYKAKLSFWQLREKSFANYSLREKCLYSKLFYSVSLRIHSKCGKMRTRKLQIWKLFTYWLTNTSKLQVITICPKIQVILNKEFMQAKSSRQVKICFTGNLTILDNI